MIQKDIFRIKVSKQNHFIYCWEGNNQHCYLIEFFGVSSTKAAHGYQHACINKPDVDVYTEVIFFSVFLLLFLDTLIL